MRKIWWIPAAIAILVFFSQSCNDLNYIGSELVPEEDQLNSQRTDTFSIYTYTTVDDSAVTSLNKFFAVGSVDSKAYGKSTAGIFAELRLPFNNLYFGSGATLDSIVLTLDYAGNYGSDEAVQNISIYRMIQRMQGGRLYYSDSKFHTLPYPIGKKNNFVPNMVDSVVLSNGNKAEPHLRIRLSDSFGQQIMAQDTNTLENDTTFLRFLNGIFIGADTLTGGFANAMMYFDLASTLSGVSLYYRNDEADSLRVTFPFTGVKSNYFTHSYPVSTTVYDPLTNPDSTDGEQLTYVQGMAGLRTVVKIPGLSNLKDISINKAELSFYVAGGTEPDFPPPPKLMLVQLDSAQHNYYYLALYNYEIYSSIIDDLFGSNDIGGAVIRQEDRFGLSPLMCTYNITRHVQEIIDGSIDNNGFGLICFPGNRILNSVTLAGNKSQLIINRPYLTITYTTVNK